MKKIALIGAPAAGKTAVLKVLSEAVHPKFKDKTVFVSEAAREILDTTPKEVISEMSPLVFQYEVYKLQIEKEQAVETYDFVITDRGAADAFVYLSESEVATILSESKEELLKKYDVVVFLFGRRKNFLEDTAARKEKNYSEIKLLENRAWEVWKAHSNILAVDQCKTIYSKAYTVALALNLELGIKLFDLSVIMKLEGDNEIN